VYYNNLLPWSGYSKRLRIFSSRRSHHLQLQAVPVPRECEDNLKSVYLDTADSMQVELLPIPPHASLTQMCEPGAPYFYVELPSMAAGGDGKTRERLFHRVRRLDEKKFS